ncbi:MAG: HlyD family secretion protein [Fimbriimonadaceae bacterium]|nr:HlyD family secretion protein [Fimbriimonadaceae bacterium]
MPDEPTPPEPESGPKRPYGRIVIVALVLVGAAFGVHNWLWSRGHESTDNAQVAGDVVLVAPLVQGTVAEVLVADNAVVKKGQPLVRLDTDKLQAAVDQAHANLAAAEADATAAGVSVDYAQATSQAGVSTSAGVLGEADADIRAAQLAAAAAKATVRSSQADARAAQSAVQSAKADLDVAHHAVDRARAGLVSAQADLDLARAGVAQAQSALRSAQATHDLAVRQLTRTKNLFDQGATSKMDLDNARAAEATSAQAVASAASGVVAAQAAVKQRASAVQAAQTQLDQNQALVGQAQTKIKIAAETAASAAASVDVADRQAQATAARVDTAVAHKSTAQGQAQGSQAQTIGVAKTRADQKQALARVEQARAALRAAEIDLAHAVVLAPVDGRVSKRSVEVGSLVQVGSAMMFLVPDDAFYVTANFKETQVSKMKPGDKVEIEIDGLPGKKLHGHVESLSPATGATFALLPPDNATGNFVKVVQRVPVKIAIEKSDMSDRLRVGLSVVATVETS